MKTMNRRALALIFGLLCWGMTACGNNRNTVDPDPPSPECTVGEPGCACTDQQTCASGAACDDGLCVGVATGALTISSNQARSCEVLLREQDGNVLDATYADGVIGAWRRRAPHVAISLALDADAAFPPGALRLQVSGALETIQIERVTCFDAVGNQLEGITASFD